jgi:hypothetical protein
MSLYAREAQRMPVASSRGGAYLVLRDEAKDERIIARLTDDELYAFGYCPFESSRQIVEHDHALAALDKGMDHVAADIPGAAGNQNGHEACSCRVSSCLKLIGFILRRQSTEAPIPIWGGFRGKGTNCVTGTKRRRRRMESAAGCGERDDEEPAATYRHPSAVVSGNGCWSCSVPLLASVI